MQVTNIGHLTGSLVEPHEKFAHLASELGLSISLVAHHNLHVEQAKDLWQIYQTTLRKAKYVDLTHTITQSSIPTEVG